MTGRCADIGSITMQQFRGLAARAPYFVNGSARNLRELVDYYDRRFDMKLSGVALCATTGAWSAAGRGGAQSTAVAILPATTSRNFLACPVIRDTSTVPCWLAIWKGLMV